MTKGYNSEEQDMDRRMISAYQAAMAASYANQVGGLTVPTTLLHEHVEIPLGFQPLGISSDEKDRIAIAAYFEPAVCLAEVTRDDQGLHLAVTWVRGAKHGIQSVRLFPDISQPGGANRAQTVNFGQSGELLVSRNGGREFFVLTDDGSDKRTLTGLRTLPTGEISRTVHSATLDKDGTLRTVESAADLQGWAMHTYDSDGDGFRERGTSLPLPDWTYGIGVKAEDTRPWLVTDFRAKDPHGIYRMDDKGELELVVPDVWGTGICFLSDGSALVSRYGQGHSAPFNGVPGALIYVPASLFSK